MQKLNTSKQTVTKQARKKANKDINTLGLFRKFIKGGWNVNLKDFEVATYKVIAVCLLANKFQGGVGGECPI